MAPEHKNEQKWPKKAEALNFDLLKFLQRCGNYCLTYSQVTLIARSWDPGSDEVETQGGNGRSRVGERERGRERECVEKCCFCLQKDLKEK